MDMFYVYSSASATDHPATSTIWINHFYHPEIPLPPAWPASTYSNPNPENPCMLSLPFRSFRCASVETNPNVGLILASLSG